MAIIICVAKTQAILMIDQHLYHGPAKKFMVTTDCYYPDWGCHVDFYAIWGWIIAGIGG